MAAADGDAKIAQEEGETKSSREGEESQEMEDEVFEDSPTATAAGGGEGAKVLTTKWSTITLEDSPEDSPGPSPDKKLNNNTTEEPESPRPPSTSRRMWSRVRQLWRKHGVVEIDPTHRRYGILCCIKEAIKDLILNHPELGPKNSIVPEDFHDVLETTVTEPGGKKFQFKSYASSVFATLRNAIGLDEQSYMQSLAPGNLPYMEFVSNSKGGRDFFLTNDKAYFFKTEKKYYVKVFLDLLDDYLNHFLKHPHSLIVKYLGLYSIKVPGEGHMYFYVMQSIYHPDDRINIRYDVKGALAGRYQQPPEEGSQTMTVLKDENFVENNENLNLGAQRGWFLEQLALDVALMKRLLVQDYSLLVAYYPLQQDERKTDFGDVALRIKKSVLAGRQTSTSAEAETTFINSDGKTTEDNAETATTKSDNTSPTGEAKSKVTLSEIEMPEVSAEVSNGHAQKDNSTALHTVTEVTEVASPEEQEEIADLLNFKPDQDVIRDVNRKLQMMSFVDTDYLDMTEAENRRLLPNTKNALHIIDGPEYRYHLGIIDFFTLYECRQRCARMYKNVKFCCGDHSTIPPSAYGDRFYNFIADHCT